MMPPVAPNDKKTGRWRTWQLLTASFVALIIGVAIGGGGTQSSDTDKAKEELVEAADKAETPDTEPQPAAAAPQISAAPQTTVASATTAKAVATTAAPAAPKQWVEVARLQGTTKKRGDVFAISSSQARLRYMAGDGFFAVYILQEGKSLDADGGFPEATCTQPCEDSTNLAVGKGRYYLEASASTSYTVVVEEFR